LQKFAWLVYKRAKAGDWEFFDHLAKQRRKRRGRPRPAESLSLVVLSGWMHVFFWLMTNQDRALFIGRRSGVSLNLNYDDPPGAIKKCSQQLGLLGWGNFRSTYAEPPLSYKPHAGNRDWFYVSDSWSEILAPPG
jgi:hypothetical protein